MPLHEQVVDAEAAEEQRGGQPHQRAADDKDGHVIGLRRHDLSWGLAGVAADSTRLYGYPQQTAARPEHHPFEPRVAPSSLRDASMEAM
ncbi:hypothetical protein GXW82_13705 [Streptacidiphilus sp. 4-A2]|nr:hypothetical protein [Streptacidiphilus sp. 4-A2]